VTVQFVSNMDTDVAKSLLSHMMTNNNQSNTTDNDVI